MTDEKARLRWFFNHTSDDVKRCALAVGAIYLDLIKQQPANADIDDDAQEETADDETPETPNAPATVDSVETQTVKPAPAPLVVIPTPVEEKQQRTPQYVPGMDLNVLRAQINAVNGVKVVQNDEDILRGKIKPDPDF